jgi:SAM-dependent methyltransferase
VPFFMRLPDTSLRLARCEPFAQPCRQCREIAARNAREADSMTTMTAGEWNERYRQGETPWDSGLPSKELLRVLEEERLEPCRTVELGCGTGTNAVALASRGFDVTGLDLSTAALEQARQKAAEANVDVTFLEADLTRFNLPLEPFDFIFDRGCYHCVRRLDVAGFLRTLERLTRPGTHYLLLAGNAHEQKEGPPRVHDHEIRIDLGPLFEIHWIREFRFEVPDDPEGFLAWSCWMTRKG